MILYKSGVSFSWGGRTAARGSLFSLLSLLTVSVSVTFFFFLIYFLAVLGPNCGTWDPLWWDVGSLVVHQLTCFLARGILVPQPGTKPVSFVLQGFS